VNQALIADGHGKGANALFLARMKQTFLGVPDCENPNHQDKRTFANCESFRVDYQQRIQH
jgi:hypothetical protein